MAENKRKRAQNESLILLGLVAAIVVTLNVVGLFTSYGRFDATGGDLYTLSPSSERLMENLDEEMRITAYFSSDLPQQFASTEREVRDLLEEYAGASGGKLTLRFVNPDTDELKEEAQEAGVQPVQHQAFDDGRATVQVGYRGLVIRYLNEKQVIPVIAGTDGLEYQLTMSMKQLLGEKLPIGVLSGHGADTLAEGLAPLRRLLPNYELQEVNAAEAIDGNLRAVLVVGANEAIPEAELQNLNTFVMNGGGLGIFGGTVKLNLEQPPPSAELADAGLNRLLEAWGARMESNLVADPQCERLPMPGPGGFRIAVPYPFFPIGQLDPEQQSHAAIAGLRSVMTPFSASISVLDQEMADVTVTPLVSTTEGAWVVDDARIPIQPRDPSEWRRTGRAGVRATVVAMEGALPSAFEGATPATATNGRVLAVGSPAIFLQASQGQMTETLTFALNAIDWLAAEEDLIAIRNKSVAEPSIEQPAAFEEAEQQAEEAVEENDREAFEAARQAREDAEAAYVRNQKITQWGLTLVLPLLLALFGIVRWRRRLALQQNINL